MTEPHPEELLAAYVDGELGAAERRSVEEHVRRCSRCAEEVSLASRARSALTSLEPAPAPAGLAAPALRGIRATRRSDRLRWVAATAAAAAVVVTIGAVLFLGRDPVQQPSGAGDRGAAESAGEAAGTAPGPEGVPRLLRTDRDYTADDLQAIVRGTNPSAYAVSDDGIDALSEADLDAAVACIERAGLRPREDAELISIELAAFEGDPAYIVLFRREDTMEIWAVDREACTIRYAATSRA